MSHGERMEGRRDRQKINEGEALPKMKKEVKIIRQKEANRAERETTELLKL